MKIDVNFGSLWANVRQMGAETVEIDLSYVWVDTNIEFDQELSSSGVEVNLEELESEQGLLSVRGRQVILFIPDHGFRVQDAIDDPSNGRKFHIADCITLDTMRKKNRFERYKVTNNLSGEFEIFGSSESNPAIESTARLNVCKNCINMLNYKGATNSSVGNRNKIVSDFSVLEFFSIYSSVFKTLPKQLVEQAQRGYAKDWKEISARKRRDVNYICQNCRVDLSSNKKLLHLHHVNGEKSDNEPSNLIVLCVDCHRKEPYHGHLLVKHKHSQLINRLRREQNTVKESSWEAVIRIADPAVRGVINHCQRKKIPPPEVGCEIIDNTGRVIAELELGWADRKIGVYLGDTPSTPGWRLFSLQQAVEHFK